jgi:hypothetical protein
VVVQHVEIGGASAEVDRLDGGDVVGARTLGANAMEPTRWKFTLRKLVRGALTGSCW